ncbi:low molecular weight protein-tyrosine-phosphatase [Streptomyces sodiiphilus]|uniref:protein-tyrosine-phosphatase n=1 Tax=Streptomyces sodiiphilus TaxID=226217 RepID=A0ABP5AS49_9ACTN
MASTAYRVCFVCTGNICRSPMGEAVLRARLAEDGLGAVVAVDSAGTGGWHAGEDADPRTLTALSAAGYRLDHTARQFRPGWFARYDLVVALDRGHHRELRAMARRPEDAAKVRLLRSFDPDADGVDVPDPYYGGADGFTACLALVEAAADGLLATVREAVADR